MGHRGTTARVVTAGAVLALATGLGAGPALAVDPTLLIQAPARYYTFAADQGPQGGALFLLHLNLARVEGEEPLAKDVKLTIDVSDLKDKADVRPAGSGCTAKDLVFTCTYSSIDGKTSVQPFYIRGAKGVKPGFGGTVRYSATASNAPAVKAATKVFIDRPDLVERKHAPLKDVAPGSTVELTPAVANHGRLPAEKGVGFKLYGSDGVRIAREHSNCHYKSWADTSAYCVFDTPLEPGAALEFSKPLRYTAAEDLMYGSVGYHAWVNGADDPWENEQPGEYDRTGDGAPLTLKKAEGTGFQGYGGHADVTTTQHADYQAVTGTVKGKVGQTVPVTLGARNAGPGSMDLSDASGHGAGTYEVTPPRGTTITSIPFPGEDDDWACSRRSAGSRTYVCNLDDTFGKGEQESLVFNIRIDKKVKGAEGKVVVRDRDDHPTRDPRPENNTAAVPVKITGGKGTGGTGTGGATGGRGERGGDSSGPRTHGGTSETGSTTTGGSGTTASGASLADTGAHGVTLAAVGSLVALGAGVGALLFARRRGNDSGTR
ncbi:hypothetical protein [Streptomyces sp. bgisy100]|uniref:hypothetical protein n=1 Tax=Streptomyces sp. bgisy100 TaxID=3413783 RepID=UPI003D73377E